MATILESMKARENALSSPEAAAQYLYDQNESTYVNDEEAKTAADALQKFAFSSEDSKRFMKKWDSFGSGWNHPKCPKLRISTNTTYQADQKKRAESWGKVIYELATGKTEDGKPLSAQTKQVLEREEKEKPVQYDPYLANKLSELASEAVKSLSVASAGQASNKQMFVTADDVLIRKINKTKDKAGSLDRGAVVFYVKKSAEHEGYAEVLVGSEGKFSPYLISEKYISDKQPAVKKLPAAKPKSPSSKSLDVPQYQQNPIQDEGSASKVVLGIAAAALIYFAAKEFAKKES